MYKGTNLGHTGTSGICEKFLEFWIYLKGKSQLLQFAADQMWDVRERGIKENRVTMLHNTNSIA